VTTVDNSGVYVYYLYYLKGIVSVCFRCPARTVGFSGTRFGLVSEHFLVTSVSTTNQAERRSSMTHLLARWEQEGTTAWWS